MSQELNQDEMKFENDRTDRSSEETAYSKNETHGFHQDEVNKEEHVTNFEQQNINQNNAQNSYNAQSYNGQNQPNQGYYNNQGYNNQGYNNQGYNNQGYNNQGYNNQGYNNQGYNNQGYNNQGYNNQGYNNQGYNNQGYNNQGYNNQGYNNQGYQNQNNGSNPQKGNSFFGGGFSPFKTMKQQQQAVPEIKTEEQARDVYYGINQQYYKKIYKNYKAGKKVSWNWSAFIFRSYWFFSRKMYAIGSLYTVAVSLIGLSVFQIYENISNPRVAVLALPWAVISIALWVLVGMYGNYIYMAHMENKIVYPNDRNVSKEKMIQLNVMRGGFSIYGILLCFMAKDLILTILQAILGLV